MRTKVSAVFILLMLVMVSSVLADDGGVIGTGGSVELMHPEHGSVRMVRERVDVKIHRGTGLWGLPEATVRCLFVFRNEGKASIVRIGFPEYSYGDTADSKSKTGELKRFRSWVDGKPIRTRLHVEHQEP